MPDVLEFKRNVSELESAKNAILKALAANEPLSVGEMLADAMPGRLYPRVFNVAIKQLCDEGRIRTAVHDGHPIRGFFELSPGSEAKEPVGPYRLWVASLGDRWCRLDGEFETAEEARNYACERDSVLRGFFSVITRGDAEPNVEPW